MTDEEMAEEYAEKVVKHKMAVHDIFNEIVTKKEIKEAVMYGLKAGRPKWHKVADGDLPSEQGGWVCNQDGLPCFFDWGTEQWLDCEGTQIRTTEWCYMPHKE